MRAHIVVDDDLAGFYADLDRTLQSSRNSSDDNNKHILPSEKTTGKIAFAVPAVKVEKPQLNQSTDSRQGETLHLSETATDHQKRVTNIDTATRQLARKKDDSKHIFLEWQKRGMEIHVAETESAPEPPTHDELADLSIPACLLCQRQFKSIELLRRHQQLSNLHKTNYEAHLKRWSEQVAVQESFVPSEQRSEMKPQKASTFQQRLDAGYLTADEARQLYAQQQQGQSSTVTSPLKSSVGAKLMAKMGWIEGSGLGREGQGITRAIEPSTYIKGAGIGAAKPIPANQLSQTVEQKVKRWMDAQNSSRTLEQK